MAGKYINEGRYRSCMGFIYVRNPITGKGEYLRSYRIERRGFQNWEDFVYKIPNFYYCKIHGYDRLGKGKGQVRKEQLAYVYWKNGILTTIIK